jgi:hypothetical protein
MIGLGVPGRPIRSLVAEDRSACRRPRPDGTGTRAAHGIATGLAVRRGRVDTDGTALGVGPAQSAARSQRDHHRDHAAARREQRGDERADQQRGSAHRSPTKAAAISPRHGMVMGRVR